MKGKNLMEKTKKSVIDGKKPCLEHRNQQEQSFGGGL